jgi:hypothetical protein
MKCIFTIRPILLLSFISALFFSACSDLHCIDGNNEMTKQARPLDTTFNKLVLTGDFSVFVVHSLKDSMSLEAESNLIPNITTEIKQNSLEISTAENTCLNPRKPIIIRVFSSRLTDMIISGSGTIQSDSNQINILRVTISGSGSFKSPVKVENLIATIAGSGNIEVWGNSRTSKLTISGAGNIDSYGLMQDSCYVAISGSGNTYLYVKNSLDATISGSGSVFYKGSPKIESHITGSGKVMNQLSNTGNAHLPSCGLSTIPSRSLYMIY